MRSVTKSSFFALIIACLSPFLAQASTYETNTGTANDQYTINSGQSVGQTITASSNHTATGITISVDATSDVKVHLTTESSNLPTATDLGVSNTTAVSNGDNLITIPCVTLTNGTKYGIWVEFISGSGTHWNTRGSNTYADGNLSVHVGSGSVVPDSTRTDDAIFTISGDDGACAGGGSSSSPATYIGTSTAILYNDWVLMNTVLIILVAFIPVALFMKPFKPRSK